METKKLKNGINLQYSSQIVETGAISLEFSPNFLHSLLTPLFSLKFGPLLLQCWATCILEQWDDCNTQIDIEEGENRTSVSRFVTSIVGWNHFDLKHEHIASVHCSDLYNVEICEICTDLIRSHRSVQILPTP